MALHANVLPEVEAVGVSAISQIALLATKTSGRCVWIGNSTKTVELDMQDVVTREKSVQGVYCYNDGDSGTARYIVENHAVVSAFVEETVRLETAPSLFAQFARGEKEYLRAVVVAPQD